MNGFEYWKQVADLIDQNYPDIFLLMAVLCSIRQQRNVVKITGGFHLAVKLLSCAAGPVRITAD